MTNGSRLDDGRVCREMVDEFAPPKFFAYVCGMEHDQLFTEFNVGAARQMCLSVEVGEGEIKNLKAQLLLREAEAAEAILLRTEASNFEDVEKSLWDETNALKERNTILEKERNSLDVKGIELETSAAGKERELTDSNALITSGKWLLTQGMELAIIKCLNSPEYLSALRAAIGKAIEKGLQDGLSAKITHGKEGRVLTDVAAHNPFVEDASIEIVMDTLHLEGPLTEKLVLDEMQPNIDQLMVPIHHSPDKVVIGATTLSLANQRSALRNVFVPLAEPFSTAVLIGTEGTSDIVSAIANPTTAMSTTFVSTSLIAPISVDDYEVIGADDQAVADGNVDSFINVDDAELNIPQ
ncbi:hypothetical protein Tco_1459201 [Tanacetum coccineum]